MRCGSIERSRNILLIDSRNGSKDLIQYYPPEFCQLSRLESGDAAFFGYGPDGPFTYPIGIELKSISDLITCFWNGRFVQGQLPKMTQYYRRIYLCVYGEYKSGSGGLVEQLVWLSGKPSWVPVKPHTSYRAFDNWLNSLTESVHLVVKRATTKAEAAAQIYNLYQFWFKEYESHKALFKFDKSNEPVLVSKASFERRVVKEVDGVGWGKSGPVSEHFKSVYDMVMAGEEEWTKVQGIGKVLAKRIIAQFRGLSLK